MTNILSGMTIAFLFLLQGIGGKPGGMGGSGGGIGGGYTSTPPVAYVNSATNNYGCSGSSTCNYTYTAAAAGNTLLVGSDINGTISSISSTGAACPSITWTPMSGIPIATGGGANLYVWMGTTSASGSCNISLALSGSITTGVTVDEASGAVGIDATGSISNCNAAGCHFSASPATTVANDYAAMFWSANNAGTATASGWTVRIAISGFDGLIDQSSIALGTTVNFGGSLFSANTAAYMVVLKP